MALGTIEGKQRFLQTLPDEEYNAIVKKAAKTGVSVQEYIRSQIIPQWMKKEGLLE